MNHFLWCLGMSLVAFVVIVGIALGFCYLVWLAMQEEKQNKNGK